MNFRIKSTSEGILKRNKIHIRSLSSLLPPKTLVNQPQQNLSAKLFYPHRLTAHAEHSQTANANGIGRMARTNFVSHDAVNNRRIRFGKFGSQGARSKMEDIASITSHQKFETKLNHKQDRFNNNYASTQIKNRSTMVHFRYRSLDMTSQKAWKTMSNNMWTAIHYQYKAGSQKMKHKPKAEPCADPTPKLVRPQKKSEYLKKGSNINKRVVVNLLKLKLQKNSQQQPQPNLPLPFSLDNTIRNSEILKMIRIYKGYGQDVSAAVHLGLEKKTKKKTDHQNQEKQQDDIRDQLDIKSFPFRNLNIELSVSEWRNKKHKGDASPLASDLADGIQLEKI